jgi:3-(3-hydroxy-phenyl)propionate hydroxylase
VRFTASPARPTVEMPLAPGVHRWEALLAPGEDPDAVARRWPADAVRTAVYAHHARRADRWRAGRVLLLGDAAHLMPPFAGQGWGAGVRDAANLAWKLALVVRGLAPDALLDTYAAERRPDVAAHTALTLALGAAVQARRPGVVALRDRALTAVAAAPGLGSWALGGGARPPARGAFGQPRVSGARLDDVVGPRFAVLGLGVDPVVPPDLAHLEPAQVRLPGRPRGVVVLRPDRVVLRGRVRVLVARA